jgi:hypothetical protein
MGATKPLLTGRQPILLFSSRPLCLPATSFLARVLNSFLTSDPFPYLPPPFVTLEDHPHLYPLRRPAQ